MTAPTDETDRLRRELEEAFEMCRAIGEERNELAFKLGEEVAENERLRDVMRLLFAEASQMAEYCLRPPEDDEERKWAREHVIAFERLRASLAPLNTTGTK